MKIFLVEDHGNAPGRIYGCFADKEDAQALADALDEMDCATVEERTLIHGQAPVRGYNP